MTPGDCISATCPGGPLGRRRTGGNGFEENSVAASAAHARQRISAPGFVLGRAQALRRLLINWLLIREDADLNLIFHGEVSLGFAFFSKFIMPLAIGHHRLVTWVMFIIAWLPVRLRTSRSDCGHL